MTEIALPGMPDAPVEIRRTARLSKDQRYRYHLGRQIPGGNIARVTFVMLNPSTADADIDDPTIRRCVGFAETWGYGHVAVVNLFALRSTDPAALARDPEPVGPDNDRTLADVLDGNGLVVAAWGAHGFAQERAAWFAAQAARHDRALHCLGTTKDGHPRHPLYVPGQTRPIVWTPAEETDRG